MNKVFLTGFTFKPIEHKRHKTNSVIKYNKIVYCVCVRKANGEFMAHVNITSDMEFPDTLEIPFTNNSYDLKGKTNVFTIKPDSKGKYIRVIRSKEDSIHFCGLPIQYTPFAHKYVYSGRIIKTTEGYRFNVESFIGFISECKGYINNINIDEIS